MRDGDPLMAPLTPAYDDAYPSCVRTSATLRIYPGALDPDEVTLRLGVEPSLVQRRGEPLGPGQRKLAALNAWFLSSEGEVVDSRDARRHLDWILDRLEGGRAGALAELRRGGAAVDLSCYWLSARSSGGPTLSAPQMGRLAALGLDLWFDVYFHGPES